MKSRPDPLNVHPLVYEMTAEVSCPPNNWGDLFDQLKVREELPSDAALARLLGVTRSFISAVRVGRKNVSQEIGEAIFARLGRPMSSADLELFKPLRLQKSSNRPDPRVRVSVMRRASGKCELCGRAAPFLTREGQPYLEIHYIVPLTLGGKDVLANAVALCPNCHRKIEVVPTSQDLQKLQSATTSRTAGVGDSKMTPS